MGVGVRRFVRLFPTHRMGSLPGERQRPLLARGSRPLPAAQGAVAAENIRHAVIRHPAAHSTVSTSSLSSTARGAALRRPASRMPSHRHRASAALPICHGRISRTLVISTLSTHAFAGRRAGEEVGHKTKQRSASREGFQ